MRFLDGSVYIVRATGTSMASFSQKAFRAVLSVYQDDRHAFVYPLTTKAPKAGSTFPSLKLGNEVSHVVTHRGLFEVPLSALDETGWRYTAILRLAAQAKKDLRTLGIAVEVADDGPLTQSPFAKLSHLKQVAPKAKPKAETDEELFERYLRWFEREGI